MKGTEPFVVVSKLSKSTGKKKDVERVITVTIKTRASEYAYTEDTGDADFTVTSKFGKSPLKISAAVIRESADTKPPISPSRIRQNRQEASESEASQGLVQAVTQVEERVTEQDFYDSCDRPLGKLSFGAANTLDMTRSVRSFDEESRTRIDFSAMSRSDRSRSNQSKVDLGSLASLTYSTQTTMTPRRSRREVSASTKSLSSSKTVVDSMAASRTARQTMQVSRPYTVGDNDFTLQKADKTDTLELLMETNEFMPLIFREKRRNVLKGRPQFSTSQEAPSDEIPEPRPKVIVPEVNDNLSIFRNDKVEQTVLSRSEDAGLSLSPIQKKQEMTQTNETLRMTDYMATDRRSRVIAPKQDLLNTSEFTELEKQTQAESKSKSSWMFIEVEKQKKFDIIEPRPNIAMITKIARKYVKSTRDFRDLGVAMTKHRYEHFVALIDGKSLAGVYLLNNDMLRMDRIWGRSQDLILCSQARKYFTYNMHQVKLVPSAEQKMSQAVDAISL